MTRSLYASPIRILLSCFILAAVIFAGTAVMPAAHAKSKKCTAYASTKKGPVVGTSVRLSFRNCTDNDGWSKILSFTSAVKGTPSCTPALNKRVVRSGGYKSLTAEVQAAWICRKGVKLSQEKYYSMRVVVQANPDGTFKQQ